MYTFMDKTLVAALLKLSDVTFVILPPAQRSPAVTLTIFATCGFTVRKISSGEGVERTFQTYSPLIASIEVKRRGDVRRAKLYYLRERSGKSARIKEKLGA